MWLSGYSRVELDRAQDRFDLRFPPDLIDLFLDRRPAMGYDWRSDEEKIRAMLAWPLDGLLFDVEQNALWLADWGDRPQTERERREVVGAAFDRAPKLIPLIGHRYLPTEPPASGNPVFSIYHSDIIYYGADLAHFFDNEFCGWSSRDPAAYRHIRFWSDFVE